MIYDTNAVSDFLDGIPAAIEKVQAGTPIPENDIWIAALALEHQQQVLSNDRHFDLVPGIERIGC